MKATASRTGLVAAWLEKLERCYAEASQRMRTTGLPTLAWVSLELDGAVAPDVFAGTPTGQARWLWRRPAQGLCLSGTGVAWRSVTGGVRRFEQAAAAWREVVDRSAGEGSAGPLAFCGFSFTSAGPHDEEWATFPAGEVVIPRVTVVTEEDRSRIVLAAGAHPDRDPGREVEATLALVDRLVRGTKAAPGAAARAAVEAEHPAHAEWKRGVADAAAAVRMGRLRKVVLARRLRLRLISWDPVSGLARLARAHPECTVFAVARRGAVFLGATPERLARVRGGYVEAMALAGSATRGHDEVEDALLAQTLLGHPKERDEHAAVVDRLREALGDLCEEVHVSDFPVVMRTVDVQHLHTGLRGRLRGSTTIFEVASRLHPTPAVAGLPVDAALDWIRSAEPLDRGWYAGAVGWVDRNGDGEFAVAIRSALVTGQTAFVLAGCGIVAGSDPEREYEESQIKMRPMLRALGALEVEKRASRAESR